MAPEARRPSSDPTRTEGLDPGAFIGREPEREAETIPGGIDPSDERIAAHSTRSGPPAQGDAPDGHREADGDDTVRREAGQDR